MSAARPRRSPSGFVPVDAARRPVLVINPASGGGKAHRARLADVARERGIELVVATLGEAVVHVRRGVRPDRPGLDLAADAPDDVDVVGEDARGEVAGKGPRRATVDLAYLSRGLEDFIQRVTAGGVDALGVAGGDGSLAVVASAVAARQIPFVCVPAGTRNHFARDVGVAPNDLLGALDAFGAALERTVDLGYVNSRPFVNNVSLGIYGDAVQQAGYRDAKLRTLLETAEEEARGSGSAPADLRLVDDRGREHRSPAVVLVSNNPYAFERPPARGARPTLDSGQLGIIVIDAPTGPPHPAGRSWSAQALSVEAGGTIPAGVDGEAVTLAPPIHFTIQPKALRVRLAPRHVRQQGLPAHQPTA